MYLDLLETAVKLANLDDRRPKQANLRRAVSNLYYSLFHFLIDSSCRSIVGSRHADIPYRNVLSRAFKHSEMNSCCKSFRSGVNSLPKMIRTTIPNLTIAPETVSLARTFCELQQNRFDADYNLETRFTKPEVSDLIIDTQVVLSQFNDLPLDNSKRLFLSCLWSWDRIKGR